MVFLSFNPLPEGLLSPSPAFLPYQVHTTASPLATLFITTLHYPVEIRRMLYTTNIVESVNSKFRKATGSKRVFPSDESVLKCLYMAALELERKWSRPVRDWASIYSQLAILFEDRIR